MTESIEQAIRSHVLAVLASLALLALAILGGQAGAAPPPAEEPVSPQAAALLSQNYTGQFVTGATIYKQRCASCHDDGLGRAPQLFVLQQMTPGAIHNSLTSGAMRAQAAGLSAQDKADVAQYLADRKLGTARTSRIALCRAPRARFDRGEPPVFAGWGLDPSNSHAIPTALAGIDRRNIGRLKLKWAFGFEGATRARSQPSLAGGAIYVGSSNGRVYALDRQTGCVRWAFDAVAEVRTMVLVQPWQAGDHRARPLCCFHDLARRPVEDAVVERLQANPDPLPGHRVLQSRPR